MDLYVGTSGYSYKEWKGTFYPDDLPPDEMLQFYGRHFATVEINNTFYRMPKASVLEQWASEVPNHFRFVLKASRRITHFQKLKNCEDSIGYLLRTAAALKDRLGPLLFQTPPDFQRDSATLQEFLQLLPSGGRYAFEFRHASWFHDEVFGLLQKANASLCVADAENDLEIPMLATSDFGYFRLRRPDYGTDDFDRWIKRISKQPWKETFVFFKHEEAGKGPEFARRFLKLVGQTGSENLVSVLPSREAS